MALLNDQGRLFGKVNLFDLVIFLLISLAVISAIKLFVFNDYEILTGTPHPLPRMTPIEEMDWKKLLTKIVISIEAENIQKEIEARIIPNNVENGIYFTRVLSKESVCTRNCNSNFQIYRTKIKIQLEVMKLGNSVYHKNKKIDINSPIEIDFADVTLRGIVTSIQDEE